MSNQLWVHKYRPKKISQLALSEENKVFLEKCLEDGEIPNLLLAGPPGVGKTALAQILIEELDSRSLVLNSSAERGIDLIRDKVGAFAKSKMAAQWNIVFMDESDGLTRDAQDAMRNMMESYADQTRFILTCNYIHKIHEPIQSRCVKIDLYDLNVKDRAKVLARILKAEGFPLDKKVIVSYAKRFTDLRKMIQAAQLSVNQNDGVLQYAAESTVKTEKLWELVEKKRWDKVLELSQDPATNHDEVLKSLFWSIPDRDNSPDLRAIAAEKVDSSSLAPDPVIHMLGTFAALMKEV